MQQNVDVNYAPCGHLNKRSRRYLCLSLLSSHAKFVGFFYLFICQKSVSRPDCCGLQVGTATVTPRSCNQVIRKKNINHFCHDLMAFTPSKQTHIQSSKTPVPYCHLKQIESFMLPFTMVYVFCHFFLCLFFKESYKQKILRDFTLFLITKTCFCYI